MSIALQKQPHGPSYYAASRNRDDDYPPLQGEERADVCVIGAGFTGISTALALAERGYKVTVLEQNKVGWGASGRNGGQIIAGFSGQKHLNKNRGPGRDDTFFELGYRGNDLIAERVAKYGIECDLKPGYIEVGMKKRHIGLLQEWYDDLCASGMEEHVELLGREETAAAVGSDYYIGGLINRRNGHIHPLNLCLGEAAAAAGLGASIHENSPVTGIEHGPKPVVVTDQGRVTADFVVLAGNAYNRLEQKALWGLLFPAGSYQVATEPLSEEEAGALNPQDLAVCDVNEGVDYFRLTADRRMLFGGRCNYSGREPRDIQGAILPRMNKIFPQLKGKRIDYAWGGMIGIVPNRVPLLGKIQPNVFYSMGYSGHGVSMTHACGEIMADAVAGTFERMDIFSEVSHLRIPFGQWFGNQMVAAGMLYYRMKDLL